MAIGKATVINGDVGPGVCTVMAIGALTIIVIWRRVGGVAGLAIGKLTMAKGDVGPGTGAIVATGALAVIVVWRCIDSMARLAIIWQTIVFDVIPIVGIMTIGALAAQAGVSGRA